MVWPMRLCPAKYNYMSSSIYN